MKYSVNIEFSGVGTFEFEAATPEEARQKVESFSVLRQINQLKHLSLESESEDYPEDNYEVVDFWAVDGPEKEAYLAKLKEEDEALWNPTSETADQPEAQSGLLEAIKNSYKQHHGAPEPSVTPLIPDYLK